MNEYTLLAAVVLVFWGIYYVQKRRTTQDGRAVHERREKKRIFREKWNFSRSFEEVMDRLTTRYGDPEFRCSIRDPFTDSAELYVFIEPNIYVVFSVEHPGYHFDYQEALASFGLEQRLVNPDSIQTYRADPIVVIENLAEHTKSQLERTWGLPKKESNYAELKVP